MLLALLLFVQDPEALLRKPEEILAGAKTISVTFKSDGVFSQGGKENEGHYAASWRTKGANLFRIDTTDYRGKPYWIASDGKTVTNSSGVEPQAALKDSNARMALVFARMGGQSYMSLSISNPDREKIDNKKECYFPDLRLLIKWSGAKHLGTEKLDGREAHKVAATATWRKRGEESDSTADVVTWLDAESGLPLKRTVHHEVGAWKSDIVETYRDWKLNAEIADDVFTKP